MVRWDILGGLKSALSRGQSIKEAMVSFHNAGYSKEEVEEAANILKMQGFIPVVEHKKVEEQKLVATEQQKPVQKISAYGQQAQKILYPIIGKSGPVGVIQQPQRQVQQVVQTISAYAQPPRPPSQAIILILIILLVLLFGALFAVFFFKEEIITFFSTT